MMNKDREILHHTESLCPVCFKRIPARHLGNRDAVFLEKECPDHGRFSTLFWEGRQSYENWIRPKLPIQKRFTMTPEDLGCPFDCGLCPDHRQHTCTAVLEVTQNCNFSCRFCFAGSAPGKTVDPTLREITGLLAGVHRVSPDANLQISGGEPTLRPDLPQIISRAVETGFGFVQLNTNGFLLARDPGLAPRLKAAGLSSVFLQFDGVEDQVYEALRGRPLLEDKARAAAACMENGIGVILVPTLVPGINIDQIGPILKFGLDRAPGIRGVHFQPVSYFGRHHTAPGQHPGDDNRITIPEVLREIESQTRGQFKAGEFRPSSCEHALCSFNGKFIIRDDGRPSALTAFHTDCCTPVQAEQGSKQARDSVAEHWKAPAGIGTEPAPPVKEDGLDKFIRQAKTRMFSVSGMAFQDAWNLDLERLKGCCIHSVAPDGRLIPFCAYNLTRADGEGLYRKP
ncbi:MAG: radical SAM protein [Desulfobacter sp.]|nr:MAG: radical SAM protein [Desulfobacter sp.]